MVARLKRVKLRRGAKFGRNQSNSCRDIVIFLIFQDGGRQPSSFVTRVWTTHEEYSVVFIAVQNLVGISVVVLKIREFQYYASLA